MKLYHALIFCCIVTGQELICMKRERESDEKNNTELPNKKQKQQRQLNREEALELLNAINDNDTPTIQKYGEIDSLTINGIRFVDALLHWGITKNSLSMVQLAVRHDADINRHVSVNNQELTILHMAFQRGNIAIVKYLIEEGANVNDIAKNCLTPLQNAVAKNWIEIIALLLKKKARVNDVENNHTFPLFIAAKNGYCDGIKILLQNGAAINMVINWHTTAINAAAHYGHIAALQLLIANGAQLHDGIKTNHVVCKQILDAVKVFDELNLAENHNINSLGDLTEKLELHTVEDSLPFAYRAFGTPLFDQLMRNEKTQKKLKESASIFGYEQKINEYIQRSQEKLKTITTTHSNATDWDSAQALKNIQMLMAAQAGNLSKMIAEIKNGADINSRTWNGFTALHFAAHHNYPDIAEYLLLNNAQEQYAPLYFSKRDNEIKQHTNATPKDIAFAVWNYETYILLAHGKNPHPVATDKNNKRRKYIQHRTESLWDSAIEYQTTKMLQSAQMGNLEGITAARNNGAMVYGHTSNGLTALHLAVNHRHSHIVEYLLQNGVNRNICSTKGTSAIHNAIEQNNIDMIRLLVENNATISEKDIVALAVKLKNLPIIKYILTITSQQPNVKKIHETLYLAAFKNNFPELAKYIIAMEKININNALLPARSNTDQPITPLTIAMNKGDLTVTQHLLAHGANALQSRPPNNAQCAILNDKCSNLRKMIEKKDKQLETFTSIDDIASYFKTTQDSALVLAYHVCGTPLFECLWKNGRSRTLLEQNAETFGVRTRLQAYKDQLATRQENRLMAAITAKTFTDTTFIFDKQ